MLNDQLIKNTLFGITAGLASTWIMTKAQTKVKKLEKRLSDEKGQEDNNGSSDDPATVKVADKASQIFLHHSIDEDKKSKAGNFVHYAFGASVGGVYGALNYKIGPSSTAKGLIYGAAVWLIADNIFVPLAGLSKAPTEYPLKTHLYALSSHLIYGGALGKLQNYENRIQP